MHYHDWVLSCDLFFIFAFFVVSKVGSGGQTGFMASMSICSRGGKKKHGPIPSGE